MSRLSNPTTASLQSMSGTFGEFQIVAAQKTVILDLQSRNWDVEGHLHRDSALAHLSVPEASRLRDLLTDAIICAETPDSRQPGLWSDATARAVSSAFRRGRRS
jgi:hypothetical protein